MTNLVVVLGSPVQPLLTMKILHYNLTTTTKAGGVETFVWELGGALARRGHAVTLLGGAPPRGVQAPQATEPLVQVERVPFLDRTLFQRLPPLRRMYAIVKLLERASMIPPALPLLLRKHYDIVHMHKPYDLLLAPWFAARGTKVVLHSHGEDFFPSDKLLVRATSAILSCSAFNANYTHQRYQRPVTVVYNGFDAERFRPQPPDRALRDQLLPRNHVVLLVVARLQPWKGVQDLVAAMALLHNQPVTLLVIGDGIYREVLEHQIRAAGLETQVRLLGAVAYQAMPRYYALADLVLGASYASETFGMALCEAMGCGKAVVASDFGGFPEVVEDGVTGLLVPPRDPKAFAQAIGSLLYDPARRAAFGAAGRARALRLFTWDAVTDRVEAVYRDVLGK